MKSSDLHQLYESAWPDLQAIRSIEPALSYPLLLSIPAGYAESRKRLMVVGQETYGWEWPVQNAPPDLSDVVSWHEEYGLGEGWGRKPFWHAAHRLNTHLNGEDATPAFVWNNLVKMDQGRSRPDPHIERALADLGLFSKELEILKPDLVVFLTGPKYDRSLREALPQAKMTPLVDAIPTRQLARVYLTNGPVAFRTYHPGHLRRCGKGFYLDLIVEALDS